MMMSLGTQSKNLGVGKVLNLSNTCINIVCINIFICVCIYSLAKTLMVVHGLTPTCLLRILHQVETKYMPSAWVLPHVTPCFHVVYHPL